MFNKLFSRRSARIFDLSADQDLFLGAAVEECNQSIRQYNQAWDSRRFDDWSYDQYSGKFRLKDGDVIGVEADAQIVGSYHSRNKTWEWSWNNPNVETDAKQDSQAVKNYGDKEKIWYFSEGIIPVVSEDQAIYFAAVGRKLSQSQAIYKGDAGDLNVYLLLKNIIEFSDD